MFSQKVLYSWHICEVGEPVDEVLCENVSCRSPKGIVIGLEGNEPATDLFQELNSGLLVRILELMDVGNSSIVFLVVRCGLFRTLVCGHLDFSLCFFSHFNDFVDHDSSILQAIVELLVFTLQELLDLFLGISFLIAVFDNTLEVSILEEDRFRQSLVVGLVFKLPLYFI